MSRSARHLSDDLDPSLRRRPRRSWRQRVVLTVLSSVVIVCLAGASVGGYVLVKYNSIDRVGLDLDAALKGEPENFLIVGSDSRENASAGEAASVSGKRSDTIMVLRVDPKSERVALLSFPRDLIVTIADTGERARINSAYSRENGEQVLSDTLKQNFGISINHYVEIDFQGFQQLVDAIGGVAVWFPAAARDLGSGLYNEQVGCVQLDGKQALNFARSRKLEILVDGEWENDPRSDLSRVERQQVFVRRALTKALSQVKSNPLRVTDLVNVGVENVSLDEQMSIGDIIDLGNNFRDFSADKLESYPLPVVDNPVDGGNTVLIDEKKAQPALNVFRGLPPGELSPVQATVQVLNATDTQGFAKDISGALQKVGFDMQEPASTEASATSIVQHAPGQATYGQLVARYITAPTTLVENPDLGDGEVVVVAGADFSTVHDQPEPAEQTTTPATGEQGTTTTTTADGSTTSTTSAAPTTTTTAPNPYVIGEPPAGKSCE
jgi:polyisoprenyl-teichoic acid--peptidoglycan teichoic acid transferase